MSPWTTLRYGMGLIVLGMVLAWIGTSSDRFSPSAETLASQRGYAHGAVVCVSPAATDVGVAILRQGGNAVDAAVAVGFALAVTYPAAGNIGGGGFMLVHPPQGMPTLFDYRETAPAAVRKDSFVKETNWYSHKAVGVPGSVRGLALAHRRFGKLPWKEVVLPAVRLAEDGFPLTESLAASLNGIVRIAGDLPELRRSLGKNDGKDDWQAGDRFVQKDLGKTLRAIANRGADAFYTGDTAQLIVAEMKRGGGFITADDLAKYEAKERQPIHGSYRGYDVYGPPPPSSGGICLVEMLNILETVDLKQRDRYSVETVHLLAETMKRAFRDRARHLGDPDFVPIPAELTSKAYARQQAATIDPKKATPSADLAPEITLPPEGDHTTHYSIIDQTGLAVATTTTLERSYGSRIVVPGAGFLLNNEMIDFNWRPGRTDRDGGIGTPANEIAPGKRMLSSMTPCIVAKNGKPILVTGSPGSRTIINTVLCVVVNTIDYGYTPQQAVDAPRLHHQWFPDQIRLEPGPEVKGLADKLRALGHKVVSARQGDAHTIGVDPRSGRYFPAADRRIEGKAGGY